MKVTVYALTEARDKGTGPNWDLYAILPTQAKALERYEELKGDRAASVEHEEGELGEVWWLDRDSTGVAAIGRYTVEAEEIGE